MIKREYGFQLAKIKWIEGDGALLNRCLEVYKTATHYKGCIWMCGKKGWREEPNKPIKVIHSKTLKGLRVLAGLERKLGLNVTCPVYHNYGTFKRDVGHFEDEGEWETVQEVFADKKFIYIVKLERNVDGEYCFDAIPCNTLEKAREVLKNERDTILKEGCHWENWESLEEMENYGIEVTDEEEHFYINDPSDDYYEDYTIVEKELEE